MWYGAWRSGSQKIETGAWRSESQKIGSGAWRSGEPEERASSPALKKFVSGA
jgi:hypothetical protein